MVVITCQMIFIFNTQKADTWYDINLMVHRYCMPKMLFGEKICKQFAGTLNVYEPWLLCLLVAPIGRIHDLIQPGRRWVVLVCIAKNNPGWWHLVQTGNPIMLFITVVACLYCTESLPVCPHLKRMNKLDSAVLQYTTKIGLQFYKWTTSWVPVCFPSCYFL